MDINNLWSDYDLNSKKQNSRCLSVNTILEGKYLVGPVLGQGGFGITYVGYDLNMESKIAIKEYFPVELVSRDTTTMHGDRVLSLSGEKSVTYKAGLKKYVAEAQNVSQFSEVPGVVSVKDFFYANETAYIVMEFIDGISLKDYLKEKGGRLSEEETLAIMKPVLEALVQVHKSGIIHRDISPDNIMLTFEDSKNHNKIKSVKLIDFGAARMTEKNDQKSLTIILKHGYAPEEQYRTHGEQGPWTDVYALCAVLYRMLTGETPVPAMDRMFKDELKTLEQCGAKVSANTAAAILKGLAVKKDDRIQSVQELISYLYGSEKVKTGKKSAKKADKKPLVIAAGAAVACLAAVVVIGGLGKSENNAGAASGNGSASVGTGIVGNNVAGEANNGGAASETEAADGMISFNDQEDEIGEQIAFYHPQRSVSASGHLLMCMPDGTVRAYGSNMNGECDVEDWDHVVRVTANGNCSIGVREDGTVLYSGAEHWGYNFDSLTDVLDVQCVSDIGSIALKKDGTIQIVRSRFWAEPNTELEEKLSSWTDMKAIVSEGSVVFGLQNDGTLIGFDEEGNDYHVTGWEKAECIDFIEIPYGQLIIGMCADGTVLTYDYSSWIEDGKPSDEFQRFVADEKVAQVFDGVIVMQDGTVKAMEGYENQRNILNGWTDIQSVGRPAYGINYYYGIKKDGALVTSMENKGNAELSEFKNLDWIQIAPTQDGMAEVVIGYTKDGKVLAYGSIEEMYKTMAMLTGDAPNLTQKIMHEIAYDRRVAWYQDQEIYDFICAEAGKLKQFDSDRDFLMGILVQEDGTAAFYNGYLDRSIYFSGVKQIPKSFDCMIVMNDGTVKIVDDGIEDRLDETRYSYVEEWTDIEYVIGCQNDAIGVKSDGTMVSEWEYIETDYPPMEKVVTNTQISLGITKEGTVEVIQSSLQCEEMGMVQVESWSNVADIAIGEGHTVAVLADGTVVATGQNNQGQCDVEEWTNVEKIYAGKQCTLGIDKDGNLLMAGIVY